MERGRSTDMVPFALASLCSRGQTEDLAHLDFEVPNACAMACEAGIRHSIVVRDDIDDTGTRMPSLSRDHVSC